MINDDGDEDTCRPYIDVNDGNVDNMVESTCM